MITGSSSGIGYSLAKSFLDRGYEVHGCSRTSPSSLGGMQNYYHEFIDLALEIEVVKWVRKIKKNHGPIKALVNNVGFLGGGALTPMYSASNFSDFFYKMQLPTSIVTALVTKEMARNRFGRIINVSSIMTSLAAPGTAGYSSAKSAIESLTRVASRELVDCNVLLNSIALSYVETESSLKFGDKWLSNMLAMQDVKSPLEVENLFPLVEYLLSEDNTHITGQTINVGLVG